MELPSEVKVGPYTYDIVEMSEAEFHKCGAYGLCNQVDTMISIYQTSNDIFTLDTLLHECLHAIYDTQHLSLLEHNEETIVSNFATGMISLLQNNPQLLVLLGNNLLPNMEDLDEEEDEECN